MRCPGLLLLASLVGVEASEGLVPRQQIGAVASVARQLARAGRGREARELVKWVVEAGVPDPLRIRFSRDVERHLERAKKQQTRPSVSGSIKRLEKTAAQLAAGLPETPTASGRALAKLILALDSSQPEANRMLGHTLISGSWVPADREPLLEKRGAIAAAIKRAHRIEVKLERVESSAFKRIRRGPTRALSWGDGIFVVHTTEVSEAAVRRVMTETLRAAAVSNWLWTGALEIPVPIRDLHVALCGEEATYGKWVRHTLSRHGDYVEVEMQLVSCSRAGYEVYRPQSEARWAVTALEDYLLRVSAEVFGCPIQPVLFTGHLHWLCLSYLEEPGPHHLYRAPPPDGTSASARMTDERRKLMGLRRESLSGLRAWMVYLVDGGEDPPWQKAIHDEAGKIEKDEDLLLKATSLAAFLQERGEFNALARKTRNVYGPHADRRAGMRTALDRPFGELERQWRDWLLPRRGVAQRLRLSRE